jgi:exoribonuclease II
MSVLPVVSSEQFVLSILGEEWMPEELAVERDMRKLEQSTGATEDFLDIVRRHGWTDHEIEKVALVFKKHANLNESCGHVLTYDGFRTLLPEILQSLDGSFNDARLRRFWTYLDSEQAGEVEFEAYFIWYLKYMQTELDRSTSTLGRVPANLVQHRILRQMKAEEDECTLDSPDINESFLPPIAEQRYDHDHNGKIDPFRRCRRPLRPRKTSVSNLHEKRCISRRFTSRHTIE